MKEPKPISSIVQKIASGTRIKNRIDEILPGNNAPSENIPDTLQEILNESRNELVWDTKYGEIKIKAIFKPDFKKYEPGDKRKPGCWRWYSRWLMEKQYSHLNFQTEIDAINYKLSDILGKNDSTEITVFDNRKNAPFPIYYKWKNGKTIIKNHQPVNI